LQEVLDEKNDDCSICILFFDCNGYSGDIQEF